MANRLRAGMRSEKARPSDGPFFAYWTGYSAKGIMNSLLWGGSK